MNEPEHLPPPRTPETVYLALILKELRAIREQMQTTEAANDARLQEFVMEGRGAVPRPRKPRATK